MRPARPNDASSPTGLFTSPDFQPAAAGRPAEAFTPRRGTGLRGCASGKAYADLAAETRGPDVPVAGLFAGGGLVHELVAKTLSWGGAVDIYVSPMHVPNHGVEYTPKRGRGETYTPNLRRSPLFMRLRSRHPGLTCPYLPLYALFGVVWFM